VNLIKKSFKKTFINSFYFFILIKRLMKSEEKEVDE